MKISLRRPLFAVSVFVFVIMALGFFIRGYDETYRLLDGDHVTVSGRVYQKDFTGSAPAIYLKNIELISESAPSQKNLKKYNLILRATESLNDACDIYDFKIGDEIFVLGDFVCFEHATNPGEFDGAEYYYSLGIIGRLKEYEILNIKESRGLFLVGEKLFKLRMYFSKRLDKIFSPKSAGILKAMLLGIKNETDPEIKALYKASGIIHIISISGIHITLIAVSIYRFLQKAGVNKAVAAVLAMLLLMIYGMLVGMPMSAKRAIGMFVIRIGADILKRTYDMLTALGITAVFMVLINPGYLLNSGFYLSFGSCLGIGSVFPLIKPDHSQSFARRYIRSSFLRRLTDHFYGMLKGTSEMIFAGISIMIFTWPIQLWFYYEIPTFSVLTNLFVLPFVSILMMSGMISLFIPGFGALGTLAEAVLLWYEKICLFNETLPFNTLNPGRPKFYALIIYYVFLCLLCAWIQMYKAGLKRKAGGMDSRVISHLLFKYRTFLFLLLLIPFFIKWRHFDKITFLDVGQGECMIIESASGENIMIDCGSSNRSKIMENVVGPYLKFEGIDRLDYVFVTHSDEDHCNGLMEALTYGDAAAYHAFCSIRIDHFMLGDIGENSKDDNYRKLERLCLDRDIEVHYISEGMVGEFEDFYLKCLYPLKGLENDDTNSLSVCLLADFQDGRILFTGDIGHDEEELIASIPEIKALDGKIGILKVAHHGSRYSTSESLLNAFKPDAAIISCGRNNRYGHPHDETLERLDAAGSSVFRTDKGGAVFLTMDPAGWKVECFN
ncbi:MAG: DNA internalization-related competence protein ComEC/Rec2 [Acetatifactor sp.]|nr:DNA internalization-related competence protein ComEC/Rec2 [Acetatifactor sp.]